MNLTVREGFPRKFQATITICMAGLKLTMGAELSALAMRPQMKLP